MKYQKVIGIIVNDFDSVIDYEMNYPLDDLIDPSQDQKVQEAKGNLCIVTEVEV